MADTVRCWLLRHLDYLTLEELNKFKLYLVNDLSRGALEEADRIKVADLLVSSLGQQEAWEKALSIWEKMGLKELWEKAKKENLGLVPAPVLPASSGSETGQLLAVSNVEVFLKNSPSSPAPQAVRASATDTLKLCSHEDFQRLRKTMAGEIYPVMEKVARTRRALIICNTKFDWLPPRNGAEYDIKGMHDLLEGLGYRVDVKENLTALAMESVLQQFASLPEHQTSDSTFLVLMSHGGPDGICGKDYKKEAPQILRVHRIFEIFNTSNCPSLKDKPKIIILQACRGDNPGVVWVNDSTIHSADSCTQDLNIFQSDALRKAHVEKDFVAFCSSTPDNMSWRNIHKGSLFIIQLIKYLREYAWCCHLYEIFLKVQNSFETKELIMQMPTIERATLTKNFYLFPGN
ncbi:caspase-13-like [Trichosurus vulpecula]|uniref:caspase-13-like n=1 Tax=Trichosurus vulpecula TaxID=9337 RepID=UPI00186B4BBA|nr:caspase-13-like [Trichosurus vulpecula]